MSKPITVLGNTYTSVAAAWRELSSEIVSLVTVRWRLRDGWHPDDAFTTGVVPPADRRTYKDRRISE